jgi:hypothetical protein
MKIAPTGFAARSADAEPTSSCKADAWLGLSFRPTCRSLRCSHRMGPAWEQVCSAGSRVAGAPFRTPRGRSPSDPRPSGLAGPTVSRPRALCGPHRVSAAHRRLRVLPTSEDALDAAAGEDAADLSPHLPDPLLRAAIVECRERLPAQPLRALEARLASGGGEPDELLAERLSMRLNTFLQNFTRARRLLAKGLEARGIDVAAELR